MIRETDDCRSETVVELDTDSSQLGLPSDYIQKLQLEILGSPVEIASPLDGKKMNVEYFTFVCDQKQEKQTSQVIK
ncbi:hypothetical protein I4U23_009840 [Adineta vaga]|nr:hypothetical protein I4U23_009840 [Adineta vaga]